MILNELRRQKLVKAEFLAGGLAYKASAFMSVSGIRKGVFDSLRVAVEVTIFFTSALPHCWVT